MKTLRIRFAAVLVATTSIVGVGLSGFGSPASAGDEGTGPKDPHDKWCETLHIWVPAYLCPPATTSTTTAAPVVETTVPASIVGTGDQQLEQLAN